MRRGLPEEILRFFLAKGGHSLLVKGGPGSGKTMFAVQLAYELHDALEPFYVSPRVSHEALLGQFPSMAPAILRKLPEHTKAQAPPPSSSMVTCPSCGANVEIPLRGAPIQATCPNCGRTQSFADRTKLDQLIEGIKSGTPPAEPLDLPEIETAYAAVDENFAQYPQKRTLLLVDPIDALDESYDIRAWRLVNVLQKDLVENSDVRVVCVLSSVVGHKLDYLVDGVVRLFAMGDSGPGVRSLAIEKLRGRAVQQRTYDFTVHNGRLWEAKNEILDWMERT